MILTETLILAKSKGLARASTVKDLVHIKTINLWGQNITDVSFISNLPQLQVISFAVNSITDLSPFQHLTSLRELYLRKNAITQASQLIHLLHLPITDLWVADNPFCALLKPYRAVMVRLFPGLRRLDDKDVTRVDRGEAEILDVGFSVGDMDGAKRFLRGLDGGQGGFNDDRGVSVARIERAQRGNEKRESWGDVELLAAVQNHMKARSSTVTAAVGDMDPTSFLSRGSRALQTSEMELRRLAAAIAHMEGPGDPVSVAGRRRRRSPPERSEGFFDDGFNVQEQKRGSVDEMKMKMFTVNAVDERPIRPMPTAVKTSVGEAMGFGNAWDDDEDEVYARRNHRTHPKDTSGLVIQGHPTRTRSKTGEKKSTPIVLPPSPVSVSPVSSEGTTSESSSIYPVVSVNDRVTHPIATLEDHIAGPGRLVHVEHKPPEGRIKHVMSHHETPVVVGEMEKLEKGYRLPTVHEEDHLSGCGVGFVHGVHVVPDGRLRKVVDDGSSHGGVPFGTDKDVVNRKHDKPEKEGIPPSRSGTRPSWLDRQGNETIVKNSIRDAGVLIPEELAFDPKDPASVKKTNVLYAIMTLLKELDPVSLRVVQHKVNLLVDASDVL